MGAKLVLVQGTNTRYQYRYATSTLSEIKIGGGRERGLRSGHQKWNIRFGDIAVRRAVNSSHIAARLGGAQGGGVPVVPVHGSLHSRLGGTHDEWWSRERLFRKSSR